MVTTQLQMQTQNIQARGYIEQQRENISSARQQAQEFQPRVSQTQQQLRSATMQSQAAVRGYEAPRIQAQQQALAEIGSAQTQFETEVARYEPGEALPQYLEPVYQEAVKELQSKIEPLQSQVDVLLSQKQSMQGVSGSNTEKIDDQISAINARLNVYRSALGGSKAEVVQGVLSGQVEQTAYGEAMATRAGQSVSTPVTGKVQFSESLMQDLLAKAGSGDTTAISLLGSGKIVGAEKAVDTYNKSLGAVPVEKWIDVSTQKVVDKPYGGTFISGKTPLQNLAKVYVDPRTNTPIQNLQEYYEKNKIPFDSRGTETEIFTGKPGTTKEMAAAVDWAAGAADLGGIKLKEQKFKEIQQLYPGRPSFKRDVIDPYTIAPFKTLASNVGGFFGKVKSDFTGIASDFMVATGVPEKIRLSKAYEAQVTRKVPTGTLFYNPPPISNREAKSSGTFYESNLPSGTLLGKDMKISTAREKGTFFQPKITETVKMPSTYIKRETIAGGYGTAVSLGLGAALPTKVAIPLFTATVVPEVGTLFSKTATAEEKKAAAINVAIFGGFAALGAAKYGKAKLWDVKYKTFTEESKPLTDLYIKQEGTTATKADLLMLTNKKGASYLRSSNLKSGLETTQPGKLVIGYRPIKQVFSLSPEYVGKGGMVRYKSNVFSSTSKIKKFSQADYERAVLDVSKRIKSKPSFKGTDIQAQREARRSLASQYPKDILSIGQAQALVSFGPEGERFRLKGKVFESSIPRTVQLAKRVYIKSPEFSRKVTEIDTIGKLLKTDIKKGEAGNLGEVSFFETATAGKRRWMPVGKKTFQEAGITGIRLDIKSPVGERAVIQFPGRKTIITKPEYMGFERYSQADISRDITRPFRKGKLQKSTAGVNVFSTKPLKIIQYDFVAGTKRVKTPYVDITTPLPVKYDASAEFFKRAKPKLQKAEEVVTLFTGTSSTSSPKILKEGLKPVGGLKEVYVTKDVKVAEGFAARKVYGQGKSQPGEVPKILEVKIPKSEYTKLITKRSSGTGGLDEITLKKVPAKYISELPTPKMVGGSGLLQEQLPKPSYAPIDVVLLKEKVLPSLGRSQAGAQAELNVLTVPKVRGLKTFEIPKTEAKFSGAFVFPQQAKTVDGLKLQVGQGLGLQLKSGQKIDLKLNQKMEQRLNQRMNMKMDQKMIQKVDLKMQQQMLQKMDQKLLQRQEQRLQQRVTQQVTPRLVTRPQVVPIIPVPPVRYSFMWPRPRRLAQAPQPKIKKDTGYTFQVRRRKKYEAPLAISVSKETAFSLGARKTLGEAAATFRIVPTGRRATPLAIKPTITQRALFRPGKKMGEYVQKEKLRIISRGEKREISYAGTAARRKGGFF